MRSITRRFFIFLCLAGTLGVLPQRVWAAGSCPGATVTSTGVVFASYDPIAGSPVTSSGTITITCGAHAVTPILDVKLSAGTSGSFSQRYMTATGSTDHLLYNLYTVASYVSTNIWGDGTSGTLDPGGNTSGVAGSNTLVLTVYGQINSSAGGQTTDPAGECPPPAGTLCSYMDSINITADF